MTASGTNGTANGTSPEIPKTCKAAVVLNNGPDFELVVEDVPVPEPGADEVLLKLNATGLCFSDIHYMLEDLPMPKMSDFGVRSPGHEGAGVVVKVGKNVTTWKVGDRGGVKPMWDTCFNCDMCYSKKHETHCAKAVSTGLMVAGTYQVCDTISLRLEAFLLLIFRNVLVAVGRRLSASEVDEVIDDELRFLLNQR